MWGSKVATTVFFDKVIRDVEEPSTAIAIEFGRSSAYGQNLMYFTLDDKMVIVDEKTGREIYDAMQRLAAYLSYDM
ncbi:hypothetical protein MesoLj113a_41760 [Mesorhizobium sp. 113-1-2]|nr:hypothetical protein MesoLj113a_41760 [Mesorhizobium sp. 113-1-2]